MCVLSIFGTRPEAIKMMPVVKELEKHPDKIETVEYSVPPRAQKEAKSLALAGYSVEVLCWDREKLWLFRVKCGNLIAKRLLCFLRNDKKGTVVARSVSDPVISLL